MDMLILKKKVSQGLKKGKVLIRLADVIEPEVAERLSEGSVVGLKSVAGEWLGLMLVGRQQKGLGWLLTRDSQLDDNWVEKRVQVALSQRQAYFNRSDLTAFRLVNGEGDGLGGVTVDWYAGFIQLNWYSQGIYHYRDKLVSALKAYVPNILGIYETQRFDQQVAEQAINHLEGQLAPAPVIIRENGIHYAIHLGQEWMTGLFLDQRQVRDYVMQRAAGKKILNLFSYTGGFSVAAAMGGASQTVSVDVANRSLAKTQENFALNGIEAPSQAHEIRVMDVFDYIRYAKRKGLTFDQVVCDPPSFARTKKYTFSALKNYGRLAADLWCLVAPGGQLVLSTNHSAYSLEDFKADCLAACPDAELLAHFGLVEDFPRSGDERSDYLKVLVLAKGTKG